MEINYKRVGERIQKARKLRKLSTSDLAEIVHFTPKSIVYAEAGQASLSLDFMLSLCSALNVSPNDLLDGEYRCTQTQSLDQESTLAELKELVETLRGELGEEAKSGTVIKDTETAMEEIRAMVHEYRKEVLLAPQDNAKKKSNLHW